MRRLLLLALPIIAGCGVKAAPEPRAPAQPPKASIESVLTLDGGDGRVYVLAAPDHADLGASTCFLHVGPSGDGTMTCVAAQISLTPLRP